MAKDRNIRIDIIKAIGIICVVLGHTMAVPASPFVNLYHVGLFFIASGIFFKETWSDTGSGVRTFLIKRIRRLYVPFVLYNLFFLSLRNLLIAMGFQKGVLLGGSDVLRQILGILTLTSGELLPGPDWFIRALFILEVLYTLVDFLIKKLCGKRYHYGRWIVSAVMLGIGYYLNVNNTTFSANRIMIPMNLETVASCWILFTAGFELPPLLKKAKISWKKWFDIPLAAACFAVLAVLLRFGLISYADNYYPNIPFFLLAAAAGFGFAYGLAGLLEKAPGLIRRFLIYTGSVTLEILMMHLTGFKIVTFILYKTQGFKMSDLAAYPVCSTDYWWAYLTVGLAFSLVFAFVWGKIKDFLKGRLGMKRFIVYAVMAVFFAVVPGLPVSRIQAYRIAHPDYKIIFDKDYYLENNKDLEKLFGEDTDYDTLLEHFKTSGMKEGLIASPDFDPHFYRDTYPDLAKAFGDDWEKYYDHYMKYGWQENRQGAESG